MCTYLAKRQSTYYFRRAIPAELRPVMGGRAEFMLSLRTKDREEAKRRIPAKTAATDRLLEEARRRVGQDRPETASPASFQTMTDAEAARFEHALEGAEIGYRAGVEKEERYEARTPDREELVRRLRNMHSVDLSLTEQAMRDLLREKDEALAAVTAHIAKREHGKLAEALPPAIQAPAPAPSGVMLDTDIVDGWAAERKPAKKGLDTHRTVAKWFYERAGKKPVDQITRRDVLTFKDKLVAEGQSAANIITKLQRLRTLLQWAMDNEHADTNPATGVTVIDTERGRNRRTEFDLASLNLIFGNPVYTDAARPAAGKGEAAYWLPLLALFTGARLEELGQLRPGDVERIAYPGQDGEEQSSWFIRIREDQADNLKLKNAGSERDVPLHPELERLGFVAFVEAAQKAKQERLFPLLKANIYGTMTAKWGEWFGTMIRLLGIKDPRMVFHSFRHTFKQYARHAGIAEGIQRQIMGHSSGDVADQYGSGYPLHQVVAGMAAYRVPGLKLAENAPVDPDGGLGIAVTGEASDAS